jgi:hypothetical protein
MSTNIDLAGRWEITDQSSSYRADLVHKQAHVTGKYDIPGGHHGEIDGFVSGTLFEFHWDQRSSNGKTGTGKLTISDGGMSMEGDWYYDPMTYGGRWNFRRVGANPALGELHDRFANKLRGKGYSEVATMPPLQWGFLYPAQQLWPSWLIGVVDARGSHESPAKTFERVSTWFESTTGGLQGNGLLLFLCERPEATWRDEICESHFYAGNIPVAAGAYDLVSGKHWLSNPGEWESQLFD